MQDKTTMPPVKYPEYEFRTEWVKFLDTLNGKPEDVLLFFNAVNNYAFWEEETELPPEISDYFNTVIRPELDRQHRKFNRKKSKRNGRK